MNFRYYIFDSEDDSVSGTDCHVMARGLAKREEMKVIDSDTGKLIEHDGTLEDIKDIES